jgi:hypothetical protein
LRLDGWRSRLVHTGGLAKKLHLAGPVRLLATTERAIKRIAADRLKRDAANCTGATLDPVIAPSVPHIAILAKTAGVYARRSAFDAKALALMVLTVQDIATAAKAAGVYARRFAFDANPVPHVTI